MDINPSDSSTFLTAGKDGSLGIWKFVTNNGEGPKDVNMVLPPKITQDNVIECVSQINNMSTKPLKSPVMITAAKWVSDSDIAVCLKNGNVVLLQNAANPDLVSKKVISSF